MEISFSQDSEALLKFMMVSLAAKPPSQAWRAMTSCLDFHNTSMKVEWETELCGSLLWSLLRLKIDTKCVL